MVEDRGTSVLWKQLGGVVGDERTKQAPSGVDIRQGEKSIGMHQLHSVKSEARAAIPHRVGGTSHRVPISPEAAARGANQGDREAGSYKATQF